MPEVHDTNTQLLSILKELVEDATRAHTEATAALSLLSKTLDRVGSDTSANFAKVEQQVQQLANDLVLIKQDLVKLQETETARLQDEKDSRNRILGLLKTVFTYPPVLFVLGAAGAWVAQTLGVDVGPVPLP